MKEYILPIVGTYLVIAFLLFVIFVVIQALHNRPEIPSHAEVEETVEYALAWPYYLALLLFVFVVGIAGTCAYLINSIFTWGEK